MAIVLNGQTNDVTINGVSVATDAEVSSAIGAIPVIGDASETIKGKVELATSAEVKAGTDTVRAVTPAGMKAGLNATGTAPIYACRAWVNFNGTGTVAIRASGNVSSITDLGVGQYTVNFTVAMSDTNFAIGGIANRGTTPSEVTSASPNTFTTGSVGLNFENTGGAFEDPSIATIQVFR